MHYSENKKLSYRRENGNQQKVVCGLLNGTIFNDLIQQFDHQPSLHLSRHIWSFRSHFSNADYGAYDQLSRRPTSAVPVIDHLCRPSSKLSHKHFHSGVTDPIFLQNASIKQMQSLRWCTEMDMYRNKHFYVPKFLTIMSRNCNRKTLMYWKRPPLYRKRHVPKVYNLMSQNGHVPNWTNKTGSV